MNFAKAGIIGLTAFILYKVISKGTAVSNLQFSIKKIAYTVASSGFILTFFITIKNIAAENILLNRLDGNIFFNDEQIGTLSNDLQVRIDASQETVIPITVNLYFIPAVNTIISLITGKLKGRSDFAFKGNAVIENIQFPVNLKYSLA